MKIEICDEQAKAIIIKFLKKNILYLEDPKFRQPDTWVENRYATKSHVLSALHRTLEFCSTPSEYVEFLEEHVNTFEVDHLNM